MNEGEIVDSLYEDYLINPNNDTALIIVDKYIPLLAKTTGSKDKANLRSIGFIIFKETVETYRPESGRFSTYLFTCMKLKCRNKHLFQENRRQDECFDSFKVDMLRSDQTEDLFYSPCGSDNFDEGFANILKGSLSSGTGNQEEAFTDPDSHCEIGRFFNQVCKKVDREHSIDWTKEFIADKLNGETITDLSTKYGYHRNKLTAVLKAFLREYEEATWN